MLEVGTINGNMPMMRIVLRTALTLVLTGVAVTLLIFALGNVRTGPAIEFELQFFIRQFLFATAYAAGAFLLLLPLIFLLVRRRASISQAFITVVAAGAALGALKMLALGAVAGAASATFWMWFNRDLFVSRARPL